MTLNSKLALTLGALAALGLTAAQSAQAQTAAFTTTGETNASNPPDYFSMGFDFTPTVNLYVTSLGFLDTGSQSTSSGATTIHTVQIYTTSNKAAVAGASASVTTTKTATAAPSTFSYTALTAPVLLTAGVQYQIVGSTNADVFYNVAGATSSPDLTIQGGFYTGPETATPTAAPFATTTYNSLLAMPNFQYSTTSPVPEASTTVSFGLLLALGLGGLVAARKRSLSSVSSK